jgi:hypothetical protein
MTSPYLAIQDADDISEPERLVVSIETLEREQADIFGGAARTVSVDVPEEGGHLLYSRQPDGIRQTIINGTMVVRRSFFEAINGFAGFFCGADTEFIHRAYYAGARFVIDNKVVLTVRRHSKSLTHQSATGFHWPAGAEKPVWVSPYRQAVWDEVERRRQLFDSGCKSFAEFGCLDPARSTTMGCIPESLRLMPVGST